MKKILFALMMLAFITPAFCQEEEQQQTDNLNKPVKNTFEAVTLIDNQTVMTPFKGAIELQIQHRFSPIVNIHDLYGIFGSANTRLGLNYGITDRIMVGIGTTRSNQLVDVNWKYKILQQTKSNSMPITLTYFGNLNVGLRDSASGAYGPTNRFKEMHRLSYLHQLIVARKFSDKMSMQVAPTLFYFNSVPTGYKNMNLSISAGGRYNIIGSHSVIFEYDQVLTKQDSIMVGGKYDKKQPQPNVAIGWEIGTATHCFQVFAANFDKINGQYDLLYNTNDFKKRKYLFGFNITVRF